VTRSFRRAHAKDLGGRSRRERTVFGSSTTSIATGLEMFVLINRGEVGSCASSRERSGAGTRVGAGDSRGRPSEHSGPLQAGLGTEIGTRSTASDGCMSRSSCARISRSGALCRPHPAMAVLGATSPHARSVSNAPTTACGRIRARTRHMEWAHGTRAKMG
jgi:hypothetical protein